MFKKFIIILFLTLMSSLNVNAGSDDQLVLSKKEQPKEIKETRRGNWRKTRRKAGAGRLTPLICVGNHADATKTRNMHFIGICWRRKKRNNGKEREVALPKITVAKCRVAEINKDAEGRIAEGEASTATQGAFSSVSRKPAMLSRLEELGLKSVNIGGVEEPV